MKPLLTKTLPLLVSLLLLVPVNLSVAEGRGRSGSSSHHPRSGSASYHPRSITSSPRQTRSSAARKQFLHSRGLKRVPAGHVIDHIVPLCAGGADRPSNMQLQTISEAKAKDRQEKAQCAGIHRRR